MRNRKMIFGSAIVILLASLACNLATSGGQPPSSGQSGSNPTDTPAQPGQIPAAAGSVTPPALEATIMASQHLATPASAPASGTLYYDVDSADTAPEHRAPYGDSYNINLFERPFTALDMNYLPQLDILTFRLTEDANWYYVSLDISGGDMNDPSQPSYGIELDTDHDGFGDYLIWATPPYASQWLAETVKVYKDTNHDTGGLSAEKSDAVFSGNGYDTVVDTGPTGDPDLAWVRLNPQVTAAVQFAFKRSLAGNAFMWGAWADSGLRDPRQFNYNDRFTEEQAGSPEKSEKYYPVQAISQVDNTCWAAVGFKPTGYEPHLCPSLEPRPTKSKPSPTEVPACPPGQLCLPVQILPEVICLPGGTLIETPDGPTAVQDLRVGAAVWTASATGERIRGRILELSRVPVAPGHELVHVVLSDGREVSASPGHPTADGRTFGQLLHGSSLDGATIVKLELLSSDQPFTYDLLPSGTTGQYWADGVLIGSTLK
jgi:hypothetical protein